MSVILPVEAYRALPITGGVEDNPRREIRGGVITIGALAALIMGWAAITPLDAAATASGQISVSGHNQLVQHREGGVIAAVEVVEGQHVKAGQVLMTLAPEDVGAQARALRSQQISLQAQRARLLAELGGQDAITWPDTFASLTGDDLVAAQDAMRSQQAQFTAGVGALHTQQEINSRRAAGLSQQINGSQGQLDATARQQTLVDQQLSGIRSLQEKGYASQNSVRNLERTEADLAGARQQHAANIADLHQQVAEAQLQSSNLERQRREAAAQALRDTEDQLNAIGPKLEATQSQLSRGTLRAQTDGVVTGLSVFSAGSVVAPGQRLMEIVPTHPVLVVFAHIAATDIEGVQVGQEGEVRFLSMSARRVPILKGTVTQVSADSFTDEKSGLVYYTAQVTVPQNQLDLVRQVRGVDLSIRPGVPVQVMIPLSKRTAFEYLFEPLSQSLWRAFRQR